MTSLGGASSKSALNLLGYVVVGHQSDGYTESDCDVLITTQPFSTVIWSCINKAKSDVCKMGFLPGTHYEIKGTIADSFTKNLEIIGLTESADDVVFSFHPDVPFSLSGPDSIDIIFKNCTINANSQGEDGAPLQLEYAFSSVISGNSLIFDNVSVDFGWASHTFYISNNFNLQIKNSRVKMNAVASDAGLIGDKSGSELVVINSDLYSNGYGITAVIDNDSNVSLINSNISISSGSYPDYIISSNNKLVARNNIVTHSGSSIRYAICKGNIQSEIYFNVCSATFYQSDKHLIENEDTYPNVDLNVLN